MRIYSCSDCGAEFAVDGVPGAGGVVCPECGARVGGVAVSGEVVIDVDARPVGGPDDGAEVGRSGDNANVDEDYSTSLSGYAPAADDFEEVQVEEARGKGYYRRTMRGPGGAYRFEMVRGAQGGNGCFTCGCLVVALGVFLMIRGCASLF